MGGIKTFFSKVWAELKKLFKAEPKIEQVVQSIVTYAAPLVETIVGLAAGGPAEALVTRIIDTVKSDLATVSVVVQDGTVAAGSTAEASIIAALTSIDNNLGELLAAAEVKNSTNVTKITAAVNLVLGEVEAVLDELDPQPAAPVTSPSPAPAPVVASAQLK